MARPLLIADAENATIEELKKVLTTRFARLKSDRANLADDYTALHYNVPNYGIGA